MRSLLVIVVILGVVASQEINKTINFELRARELIHKSNWGSMGTIEVGGICHKCPTVVIVSIADDAHGNIIFPQISYDFAGRNLAVNKTVTFMFTEEQNLTCKNNGYDPFSHNCTRVLVFGEAIKLDRTTIKFSENLEILNRTHPASTTWYHKSSTEKVLFDLYKVNMTAIRYFGPGHMDYVPIDLQKYNNITLTK